MPPKTIHYVQLRTYRQWPNQSAYVSHLNAFHSKIKPITYHIDRIVNNKWIDIQRSQFNRNFQQEIKKDFLHKINLIDYKYSVLNDQFDENNRFIREIFIRSFEIIDELLFLFEQIQNGEKQIYEYRLNLIKFEFENERESLKHLFINQEFKELDNQINVLNALEEEDFLQQSIQFKLNKRQLEEQFFKDTTILHGLFNTQIISLRSTINSNLPVKHFHHLSEKVRQGKERIDQEMLSIGIVKRKINETRKLLENIDKNNEHVYDKLHQLKRCPNREEKKRNNRIIFRRLSALTHNIQKTCQKKLIKAEHLLLLINQCQRLEFEDEKLLLSTMKIDFNQMISQVSHLNNCHFEYDSYFDELSLFWKRFAHVQIDYLIRKEEQKFLKKHFSVMLY